MLHTPRIRPMHCSSMQVFLSLHPKNVTHLPKPTCPIHPATQSLVVGCVHHPFQPCHQNPNIHVKLTLCQHTRPLYCQVLKTAALQLGVRYAVVCSCLRAIELLLAVSIASRHDITTSGSAMHGADVPAHRRLPSYDGSHGITAPGRLQPQDGGSIGEIVGSRLLVELRGVSGVVALACLQPQWLQRSRVEARD